MRYVTIPKADWDEPPHLSEVSSREVIVEDDAPVKTGLLDQTGAPLYRVKDRLPFGFVRG